MVFDVIPFYEIKSIWIGKSNGGKFLEYEGVKRAYSKCVENEICPGFVDSSQESAAMLSRRSTRGCLRPRQVPTICTTSKTWLIVHANCFGKTSWRSFFRNVLRLIILFLCCRTMVGFVLCDAWHHPKHWAFGCPHRLQQWELRSHMTDISGIVALPMSRHFC